MTSRRYWSESAADDWEHGLVVGDGRTGALLFGTPPRHLVTVTHERVVLPTDAPRAAPDLAADLPLIRELIDSGRAQDAAELGVTRSGEQGYPGLQWTDPLVPSATLAIENACRDGVTDYRRDVDLGEGSVTVSWRAAGRTATIRVFASRFDAVTIVDICGIRESDLSIRLEPVENVVTTDSGVRGGNDDHVRFTSRELGHAQVTELHFNADWEFQPAGSTTIAHVLTRTDDRTVVAVEVLPGLASDDDLERRIDRLRRLPDVEALAARHAAAYADQVQMSDLDLGAPPSGHSTEVLLSTETEDRFELLALQYAAAQAAIAASTGDLPPTLQGVWSGTFDPAWSSDYTMNGNVQCGSIAGMLGSAQPRLLRSYLGMLEGFADDFRDNAARLFGADGYVLPSRCSPNNGRTTHFDARHCHEFWTAGGAWAACFFLDDAWYSADVDHLRDHGYPFAREVERFYETFLDDGDDMIVFSPSYSPENRSPTFASQLCRNATMDRASLHRMLEGLLRAAEILGVDDDLAERRRAWLARLPDYRIAPDGTLAEWLDDDVIERVGHRTASHLLGLWFEVDEVLRAGPLRDAVRTLIDRKLAWRAESHHEEMAYGLVQLGLAAAAIGHTAGALECVDRMSRLYFFPSLATSHNVGAIFNVDIAGGFPAVVNAMLVGSPAVDRLELLPALPDRWPSGSLTAVHARGAIRIDSLEWTPITVTARITTLPGSRAVRRGVPLAISLPAGWTVDGADGTDGRSTLIDPPDETTVVVTGSRS